MPRMGETWWRRHLGRQRSWRHAIASRSGLPDQAAQFQQARQRPLSLLVVWTGRRPRLYMTWDECKAAVVGGRRKFQEGL